MPPKRAVDAAHKPTELMEPFVALHPLFHLGALAAVVALALRSQFQLRLVLLLSFLFYAVDDYFGYADHAWPYQIWNLLFFSINLVVLIEIVLDRTTFGLSAEEKAVLSGLLSLTPGQFRKLIRIAEWRSADRHQVMTTEGTIPASLFFVHTGTIEVMKGERSIMLEPPTFIGEVAFLRGSPASATVAIAAGARYIEWPTGALRRHLGRHNALRVAFNRTISDDLATKVARG